MERDYAERRGDFANWTDSVEVDTERKVGHLILDRPPLNIVSFKGVLNRAIIEAFDEDDDVGVIVIRGANDVFSSGGDVKKFPEIPKNKMSDLADNIGAPERYSKPVMRPLKNMLLVSVSIMPGL